MKKLVLMNVTNGGNMLDHSPMKEWPLFHGKAIESVALQLGLDRYRLRTLVGYKNRGGLNNADMGRWINKHYGDTQGLKLVFEVEYNDTEQELVYKLLGQYIPFQK